MLCIHNGLTLVVTIGLVFVTDWAGKKNNNPATLTTSFKYLNALSFAANATHETIQF